jgi:hypothetical protein
MSDQPMCSACAHWLGDAPDRRKKAHHGTCVAAQCYIDFQVRGGFGCHECDPCGMNEATLRTRSDFHCKHFVKKVSA